MLHIIRSKNDIQYVNKYKRFYIFQTLTAVRHVLHLRCRAGKSCFKNDPSCRVIFPIWKGLHVDFSSGKVIIPIISTSRERCIIAGTKQQPSCPAHRGSDQEVAPLIRALNWPAKKYVSLRVFIFHSLKLRLTFHALNYIIFMWVPGNEITLARWC